LSAREGDTSLLQELTLPASPPILTGDRVVLRAPAERDIDDRLRYPIDPDEEDGYGGAWRRSWDGRQFHDRDDLVRRRRNPRRGEVEWSVEYAGECIGSARLRIDASNHRATFSLGIFAPHLRGIGLGRETTALVVGWGFDDVGLHRIELEVLATNDRAICCYRACGFVVEGTRREAELYPDGWRDFLVMGVLRQDLVAQHH
jgi:RimJ/RimL family protein N-acetyltransferase